MMPTLVLHDLLDRERRTRPGEARGRESVFSHEGIVSAGAGNTGVLACHFYHPQAGRPIFHSAGTALCRLTRRGAGGLGHPQAVQSGADDAPGIAGALAAGEESAHLGVF